MQRTAQAPQVGEAILIGIEPRGALVDEAGGPRLAAAGADRAGAARARSAREPWSLSDELRQWTRDPLRQFGRSVGRAAGAYFEQGLIPASRRDGEVYRAIMRVANMLDDPRSGLISPAIVTRVLPYVAESLWAGRPSRTFPGPTRDEALDILRRVASPQTRSASVGGVGAPTGS